MPYYVTLCKNWIKANSYFFIFNCHGYDLKRMKLNKNEAFQQKTKTARHTAVSTVTAGGGRGAVPGYVTCPATVTRYTRICAIREGLSAILIINNRVCKCPPG